MSWFKKLDKKKKQKIDSYAGNGYGIPCDMVSTEPPRTAVPMNYVYASPEMMGSEIRNDNDSNFYPDNHKSTYLEALEDNDVLYGNCDYCGKSLLMSFKFCPFCGMKL